MLVKMNCSSGGSNCKIKEGTFQSNASVNTIVDDIGFLPDYLYIETLDTVKPYVVSNMWLPLYPQYKITMYRSRSAEYPIISYPSIGTADTTRGTLLAVNADGFTWGPTAGNANYAAAPMFKYMAVKWS